jgi:hypothetical protein
MGNLSFIPFENYAELYDYSPSLHKHVQDALGKTLKSGEPIKIENTDIAQQVLMSTTPVLTESGIKLKVQVDTSSSLTAVLAAIDNYTPVATILHRLTELGLGRESDIIKRLNRLENAKAIYPIFPRVNFLANCFKNQIAFSIADYLVAAELITKDQLDELLLELNSTFKNERLSLGALALKKQYFNARELEIILQDQAYYGQNADKDKVKPLKTIDEESQVQSLVGRLGITDPGNLLQNIAQNRETGVLSAEYKDLQFRSLFETGRPTHARLGQISGNAAIIEFVTCWREGVFVFTQRTPPPDLVEAKSALTKPLDNLLLDSALAKDNLDVTLSKLQKGLDSILEKTQDDKNILENENLLDPDDQTPLPTRDITLMKQLWQELDGLSTLAVAIRRLSGATTVEGAKAAERLLNYRLVMVPKEELAHQLDKFRKLCQAILGKIGAERGIAFLRLSLKETIGYSIHARMFILGANGEVGIDLASARSAGASLSSVIRAIEDWQVKFVEHASQEIKPDVLISLIREVHQA